MQKTDRVLNIIHNAAPRNHWVVVDPDLVGASQEVDQGAQEASQHDFQHMEVAGQDVEDVVEAEVEILEVEEDHSLVAAAAAIHHAYQDALGVQVAWVPFPWALVQEVLDEKVDLRGGRNAADAADTAHHPFPSPVHGD